MHSPKELGIFNSKDWRFKKKKGSHFNHLKNCHIDDGFGFICVTPVTCRITCRRTISKLKLQVNISLLRKDFVRSPAISRRNELLWERALLKWKVKTLVQFMVEGISVLYRGLNTVTSQISFISNILCLLLGQSLI